MFEVVYSLLSYAPLVIFFATTLDILFVTGFFLYGAAMMSTVGIMHATGTISITSIIVSAYLGTMLGNVVNYFAGRSFGKTSFVANKLANPKLKTARGFLKTRGLFLYMLAGRFITVTRPLYALLLGSLKIKFRRFILYESMIAFFWIVFWLYIIIKGEELYFYLFG